MKKLYVVTKYIFANSIEQAIKLDKETKPYDVYVDPDWRKFEFSKN